MGKKCFILIMLLILGGSLKSWAQESFLASNEVLETSNSAPSKSSVVTFNPFQLFQAVKPEINASLSTWESLEQELAAKAGSSKDELQLLRQIFQKSHQRLFKKYQQHSTFNEMLSKGNYDCVSGSAALGILLDRFGFSYDIIETDYHVFILAEVGGKKIVLESTLPVGGMITQSSEVEKYLASYAPNQKESSKVFNQRLAGTEASQLDNSIFRKVNLQELAGLQFYNDAIVHFNTQQYQMAIEQLEKAYLLYPSERVLGLLELSKSLLAESN